MKAFKDKKKAEDFVRDCESESLRVDLAVENYWSKYKEEYDELAEFVRDKIFKGQYSRDIPEVARMSEISMGEKKLFDHKYFPNYRVDSPKGQFVCDAELELVE